MSVFDDFNSYLADHGLLRGACYLIKLNKVSDSDIGKWLTVLIEAFLVRIYPAEDGERYLELFNFQQRTRAKESKFPNPPNQCQAHDRHMPVKRSADAQPPPDTRPSNDRLDGDGDSHTAAASCRKMSICG
jgi:hypothetical protein